MKLAVSHSFGSHHPQQFDYEFHSDGLLVLVQSPLATQFNWIRAGFLSELNFVDGIGTVKGSTSAIVFGRQFIRLQPFLRPYQLLFEPQNWIRDAQIQIYDLEDMPLSNPATIVTPTSTAATSSTVAAAIASTLLLAANGNRKGGTIWNASTATLYLDLDSAASTAAYAAQLSPGGYYEVPFGYVGDISGIWSAANGSAHVRELT